ncbi:UNVERIFIED_CONTAM: nucleoside monophosphate kinase [Campylobacter lari]
MIENKVIKNIVFMGPPGVGKGTVAALIAEKTGLTHLSTGSIFREEIASKSELGLKVMQIVESGGYVPDEITNEIVFNKIKSLQAHGQGVLLDGYPRTVDQGHFLDSIEDFKYSIVELEAPQDLILRRLSGRRSCPKCKTSYHIEFMPSAKGDKCEKCDTLLITRADDTIENIKTRQEIYIKQTEPLLTYYRDKIHVFNATGTPEEISNAIIKEVIVK